MIYKRGNVYWFQFVYNGVRYRESTGLTHKAEAMRVEARKKPRSSWARRERKPPTSASSLRSS